MGVAVLCNRCDMRFLKRMTAGFLTASMALCLAACGGENTADHLKNIEKPKTAATQDEADFTAKAGAVEESPNVNGMRFNMTLQEFTQKYNEEKTLRQESDLIFFGNWQQNGEGEKDANNVAVEYWHYDDSNVSFTATVESATQKILNIGCGTTMNKFMGMTGDKNNSDLILGKAALMAQTVCGFPSNSEPVLQDIFFRTTTESSDTLWYSGYVFHLSTKEDKNDSKNNIMLFRVFPITEELKKEWKLAEY